MKRIRTWMTGVLLTGVALLPLPGCARGANPIATLLPIALSVGASIGSYYLIKELD
jgi:hypothetical protein